MDHVAGFQIRGGMEGLSALVIESEERERKLIVALLSSQSIQVDAFQSPWHYRQTVGEQCFACCEHSQTCDYDLIFTGNDMPGMNGLDFLNQLEKADCQLPPERKAISARDWTPQEKERAIARNYQVFTKPFFTLSDVLDWIDEISRDS